MNKPIQRYCVNIKIPSTQNSYEVPTWGKVEALIELDNQLDEFFKIPFFVTMSCRNAEEFLKEVNRLQSERLDALEKIYVEFKEKCEEK